MYGNGYHEERTWKGKKIIIDLAQLDGKFEVMVLMANDGEEIESQRSGYFVEAAKIYQEYLEKYQNSPKPLTGKYAKLRNDLIQALAVAEKVANDNPEDGGTCNFDSPAIFLPRWRESLVEQAAKEAGTSVFKWNLYGSIRYVISPNVPGQANRRTRAAEAMEKALEGMGYETGMYYQAD